MTEYITSAFLLVFAYMTLVFFIALARKDNSLVDVAWGAGFVLLAFLTLFLKEGLNARQILVTLMVFLWGSRLAAHIYTRNKGRAEDFRYAQWRKDWGRWFVLRSYLQIFLLQGLLMLLISYPVILVNISEDPGFTIFDLIGVLLWGVGFFFEATGDYQLRRFKSKPEHKGKIMTSGLWRFTRHPNYFGEAVMWWGIFVIAVSMRHGWTAVVSPVVITFLLLKVSGVTMLEKKYEGNEDFAAYARRTNAFFPWFPKSK